MPIDLTTVYLPYVDEAFTRESKRDILTNKDFSWAGANTVKIYKITTAPMNDYDRAGTGPNQSRYGEVASLDATTQSMMLRRDRSFTFAIDTLDKDETAKQLSGADALARQVKQVVIPEVDAWTYNEMCTHAHFKLGITPDESEQALPNPDFDLYGTILQANEFLDDAHVPETGRFILISPRYYTMLKKSDTFFMQSDIGQEMRTRGVVGYIDGLAVIKVPASRLPENFIFLAGHPCATVAPVKLDSYKVHDNPPGISGDLVEGRINYDAFVLDNKAKALAYCHINTQEP